MPFFFLFFLLTFFFSLYFDIDDRLRWDRGLGETAGCLRSVRRQQFHLPDRVGNLHGASVAARLQPGCPAA